MEWIKVEDKLPLEKQWVIVLIKKDARFLKFPQYQNRSIMNVAQFETWSPGKQLFDLIENGCGCCNESLDSTEVSHWMPLPQLPEGES